MAVHTREKNSTIHPGKVLLTNRQPRRTRQQIDADEARAAAAARATTEEAAANHSAILGRIAQLEDSMEQEDAALRMHSTRLDMLEPMYVTEFHQQINGMVDKRYREPEELEEIAEEEEEGLDRHLSSPQPTDTTDDSASNLGSIPDKEGGGVTEDDSLEDMGEERTCRTYGKRKRAEVDVH
jgi:hypothetical protein